jgi:hypothetical protein
VWGQLAIDRIRDLRPQPAKARLSLRLLRARLDFLQLIRLQTIAGAEQIDAFALRRCGDAGQRHVRRNAVRVPGVEMKVRRQLHPALNPTPADLKRDGPFPLPARVQFVAASFGKADWGAAARAFFPGAFGLAAPREIASIAARFSPSPYDHP